MNKNKLISRLLLVVALGFFSLSAAFSAPVQRVIIEDFTGTWCGWCPGGTVNLEDSKAKYPGQVIGVAVHNADPMATVYEPEMAKMFGVSGYPNGAVNRALINTGTQQQPKYVVAIDRGNYDGIGGTWGNIAGQILANAPMADVNATYSLDKNTRTIIVTVTANILKDIANQTAFNAIVIEDGVQGPQNDTKWSQANYYSNNAQQSSHPWFGKPSLVYTHYDDVLRDYLGGSFGDMGDLPKAMKTGETYAMTFVKVLPANVNLDKIRVVGALQYALASAGGVAFNSYINSNYAELSTVAPSFALTDGTPAMGVAASTTGFDKGWECKNLGTSQVTFTLSVMKSSRTPGDWNVVLDKTSVDVAGGSSANCKLTITPGATKGIGDAFVTIKSSTGTSQTFKVTLLSKELNKFEVNIDNQTANNYTLASLLNQTADYKDYFALSASDAAMLNYISDTDILVVSTGNGGYLSEEQAESIGNLISKGTRVYINGCAPYLAIGANMNNKLVATLGLKQITNSNVLQSQQYKVKGISGDPISDGADYSLSLLAGAAYYPLSVPVNTATTSLNKFLTLEGAAENGIGYRGEINGTRVVITSLQTYALPLADRLTFTTKVMDWLTNKQSVPTPKIIVSTEDLQFGTVPATTDLVKNVTVRNTGSADLVLSAPEFVFGDVGFTLTNTQFPITLQPSQETSIQIKFTPAAPNKNYDDSFKFTTNDKTKEEVLITLSGKGGVTSIEDGVSGLFYVKLLQNPIKDGAKLEFNLGGTANQNVTIQLVDASGAVVAELANGSYAPGLNTVNISTSNLASGSYFIMANANGVSAKLSTVVVK